MKFALALIVTSSGATAQEFVPATARLADTDFYRLVACAAPVGGPCQKDVVRWSPADAQNVSVGIVKIEAGFPQSLATTAAAALNSAIDQLNATGADLHVTIYDGNTKPDISIYLLGIVKGDAIRNTGFADLDGAAIQAAKAQLWWRDDRSLIEGAIVFAKDIDPIDLPSIMLEEVTQSMGLLTDIGGPYYQTRSVFSETSNQVAQLGDQDVMALRRHYQK